MPKNSDNNQWIILALIVIIIVGAIYVDNKKIDVKNLFAIETLQGATVLSISNVQFLTGANGTQNSYLINLVAGGGGERLEGTISAATLQQYGITNVPQGPFSVDVETSNISCNYDLVETGEYVYDLYDAWAIDQCLANPCPYSQVSLTNTKARCVALHGPNCAEMIDIGAWCSWFPEETNLPGNMVAGECDEKTWQNQWSSCSGRNCATYQETFFSGEGRTAGDWRVEHISGAPVYKVYKVASTAVPDYVSKITITNSAGQKVEGFITPHQTSDTLGGLGQIKWAGNLIGAQFCPIPAVDMIYLKDPHSESFLAVDKDYYDVYKGALIELRNINNDYYTFTENIYKTDATVVATWTVDPGVGAGPIFTKFSALNAIRTQIPTNLPNINYQCSVLNGESNYMSRCSTTGAVVYPQMQLRINADWVGVRVLKGIPVIKDVRVPAGDLRDGSFVSFDVTVENAGEPDSFDMFIRCEGKADIPKRIGIKSGETITTQIPFYVQKQNTNCNLVVQSVNDANTFVSTDLNLSVVESVAITNLLESKTLLLGQISDLNTQLNQTEARLAQAISDGNQQLAAQLQTQREQLLIQILQNQQDFRDLASNTTLEFARYGDQLNNEVNLLAREIADAETRGDDRLQSSVEEFNIKLRAQQQNIRVLQQTDITLDTNFRIENAKLQAQITALSTRLTATEESLKLKIDTGISLLGKQLESEISTRQAEMAKQEAQRQTDISTILTYTLIGLLVLLIVIAMVKQGGK